MYFAKVKVNNKVLPMVRMVATIRTSCRSDKVHFRHSRMYCVVFFVFVISCVSAFCCVFVASLDTSRCVFFYVTVASLDTYLVFDYVTAASFNTSRCICQCYCVLFRLVTVEGSATKVRDRVHLFLRARRLRAKQGLHRRRSGEGGSVFFAGGLFHD